MTLIDTRAARVLFTALLFACALAFIYLARHTLIIFLFAIFFAYLIEPLVSGLHKWVRSRGWAIAGVYVLLAIVLSVVFFFVGPQIARESGKLTTSLPPLLDKVSSGQIAIQVGSHRGWSESTQRQVQNFLKNHRSDLNRWASRIGFRLAELAQNIWWLVLIPILAEFFLKDGRRFIDSLLGIFSSRSHREFLEGVINDLDEMLAHFIRAQLTLAGLALVAYIAALSLLRVPYALVLGTMGGILEFIPVVGPLTAAAAILVVAFLTSYPHVLVIALFLGSWRLIQDYLTAPRIMGKSVELHPLAPIFGVLAGAEVAGVIGVFLSIPIMASMRIVWRRWRIYAEKRKFGPLEGFAADLPPIGTH